jgi:flagellar motor switch protein FliN/FliY
MADDAEQIGQDEIENLLNQAKGQSPLPAEPKAPAKDDVALDQSEIEALMGGGKPAAKATAAASPPPTGDESTGTVGQSDVELLLNQAEQALASINGNDSPLPEGAQAFQFKDFVGTPASTDVATLQLMQDVELDLNIELGRTHMQLEDVLRLRKGAVVTLDKLAGDPVDIYVNGRLIARGEVLVLNDNFCVRVAELIVGESACA